MHGCSLGSPLLVNAEVDSMGGVVDGGAGIGTKTSPRRAAIEKAQAELRQEYDVREERRRELEFLEKGGDPLDFKFGNAASVSVQSTSLNNQPPEQFVTSEAKGSFALAASSRGDSVESSGRPWDPTVCEPNYADNLLLFDGESEFIEGEKNSVYTTRSSVVPSEQSSRLGGSQNAKESGDLAAFRLPKNRAYKRRHRSRPNRDCARSSSTDMVHSRGDHVSSLPSRQGPKDAKGSVLDANNQRDKNISLNSNSRPTSPKGSAAFKALPSDGHVDRVLDNVRAIESITGLTKVVLPEPECDFNPTKSLQGNQRNQQTKADAQEISATASEGPESVRREQVATAKAENQTSFVKLNGFTDIMGYRKGIPNEGQNSSASFSKKGLDSQPSCTQTSGSLDGNNDSDLCNNLRNVDSNGINKEQALVFTGTPPMDGDEMLEDNHEKKADDIDNYAFINDEHNSVYRSHPNGYMLSAEEELHGSKSDSHNEVRCHTGIEGMEVHGNTASETETKPGNSFSGNLNPLKGNDFSGRFRSSKDASIHDNSHSQKENPRGRLPGSMDPCVSGISETTLCVRGASATQTLEQQTCAETRIKLSNKAHEDSILEEAQIIEAKHKRIAELSVGTCAPEIHLKSHWNFVLEEISWLANDFAQERLWKITAAAQVCHRIASTSQLRFEEQNLCWKQKKVSHTLAKSIMEFWHSAQAACGDGDQDKSEDVELQYPGKDFAHGVQGYALRFLKYNASLVPLGLAEAPVTPDRISDVGIQEMSWEDHFTEENLFYTVPPGAMETYRKSLESHIARVEKTGGSIQEALETSIYDAAADNAYEEDEGEAATYYLAGSFEGNKPQKKRKSSTKSYAARSYDLGIDSPCMQFMENKVGAQQYLGKRPANSLNVGPIPTKRIRTASRQRVLCPFGAGTSGGVQGANKTDAFSGDTNSFQDDQGTFHVGSHVLNGWEVESVDDFGRQLAFDSTAVSKPKKKKKAKHLGSTYEQRWQLDNDFQNELRDHSRKRLQSHQLESNESSGLFGQHIMKRQKMRQSLDNSFDNLTPITGSIPSPVASQMSNMSNSNKLIKILSGRDRGRKAKLFKMPAGQPGSGSPWSLFEDQALVVLVHDMGPNWELISDAVNSSLQFKCTFRNPEECKERHKVLMDRTAGDGADSAEDSGSSQPYPSTLPGIPKGSARQLLKRLQGPMEEDTIKTHFEKIIMISQKLHYHRTQKKDNQDPKAILAHNSHTVALSQVFPNNLNGGALLTPLDLCDTTASSPDVHSVAYQGSQACVLAITNQSNVASVLPASGVNASLQGSSNMVLGNNFSTPSGPVNAPVRDGRFGVPRSASLSIDEQQRMQKYNQMLSGRNNQHSGLSVSGTPPGADRGACMSGGNGMGVMCGINRSVPMTRPGFQGIASSSMLNSGNMLSSSTVATSSPVNMHHGVSSGQGNTMLRPRDTLNMIRPVQNPEHQRQKMVPELQMQATQGISQGVPLFDGLNSTFSNQTSPPPTHTYPLHQQQHQTSPQQSHVLSNPHLPHLQGSNPASSTQHHSYAIHLAKERQLQQRLLLQQQQQHRQQFATSNALMPHVQPQLQSPVPSSAQSSSQVQPQTSSASVSMPPAQSSSVIPMSQQQQKLHMLPHAVNRNPQTGGSGLNNHIGKQRQRQLQQQQSFQQSSRHHPQQWKQSQSQQQAKLIKGGGRGSMLMPQNLTTDSSLLNGLSTTCSGQSAEKGELHLIQDQGLYSGSGLSPVQPSKPLMSLHCSNQSHPQQKMYSGQAISSSKQVQQMPSHFDNKSEGYVAPPTSGHTLPASHQVAPPSVMASTHQQLHPKQKLVNQTQPAVQRVFQQNRQLNCDPPSKLEVDQAQAEPQPVNRSSHMNMTTEMPQPTIEKTTVTPVVSSSGTYMTTEMPQPAIEKTTVTPVVSSSGTYWRASEQMYDSGVPNRTLQLTSIGSVPSTNYAGTEPMPTASQGLGQGQSSGSLPPSCPSGHNLGLQWQQQQQSQLQPPSTPLPSPPQQQQQVLQQQLPPQQQTQHLQAGHGSLYIIPTKSRLE